MGKRTCCLAGSTRPLFTLHYCPEAHSSVGRRDSPLQHCGATQGFESRSAPPVHFSLLFEGHGPETQRRSQTSALQCRRTSRRETESLSLPTPSPLCPGNQGTQKGRRRRGLEGSTMGSQSCGKALTAKPILGSHRTKQIWPCSCPKLGPDHGMEGSSSGPCGSCAGGGLRSCLCPQEEQGISGSSWSAAQRRLEVPAAGAGHLQRETCAEGL